MDSNVRKYTLLSFLILSAVCGFIFYLASTMVADLMRFGGSNVAFGLSWPVLGGGVSVGVGTILFIGLALNHKASDFTDEVFQELLKTTWPNFQETSASTVVVTVMVGIAAVILFLMDQLWGALFSRFL